MTEFTTLAELRTDIVRQRDAIVDQIDAHQDAIADLDIARRIEQARLDTLDQAEAIGSSGLGALTQQGVTTPGNSEGWPAGNVAKSHDNPGDRLSLAAPRIITPHAPSNEVAPRQRQDVHGPVRGLVLELVRGSKTGLTADEICKLLPAVNLPSILAALRAAVRMETIKVNDVGVYWGRAKRSSQRALPKAVGRR